MEEKTEALKKANDDLEALKNSEACLWKGQAKVRTLEGEKTKARNKYFKIVDAEKDEASIEQEIAVLEDLQYCAKVMQTYFAEIRDFSWLFDEKISNSRWKRIFNEKSR